jgi:hypothetical protein
VRGDRRGTLFLLGLSLVDAFVTKNSILWIRECRALASSCYQHLYSLDPSSLHILSTLYAENFL